jgi:hypothetical protein
MVETEIRLNAEPNNPILQKERKIAVEEFHRLFKNEDEPSDGFKVFSH